MICSFALDADWWIKLLAVGIVVYYGYKIFNMPHTLEKVQRKVFDRGVSSTAHYAFYDEAFRVSGVQSASMFPYFQITASAATATTSTCTTARTTPTWWTSSASLWESGRTL